MCGRKVYSLLDLCAGSDAVTLNTPNVLATRRLMGAIQFEAIKDRVVVINTECAACIDETALIRNLNEAGYSLIST